MMRRISPKFSEDTGTESLVERSISVSTGSSLKNPATAVNVCGGVCAGSTSSLVKSPISGFASSSHAGSCESMSDRDVLACSTDYQSVCDQDFCEFASCEPQELNNNQLVSTPRLRMRASQEEEPVLAPVISSDLSTLSQSSMSPTDALVDRMQRHVQQMPVPRILHALTPSYPESTLKRRISGVDSEGELSEEEEQTWVRSNLQHIDKQNDSSSNGMSTQRGTVDTFASIFPVLGAKQKKMKSEDTLPVSNYPSDWSRQLQTGYAPKAITPTPSPHANVQHRGGDAQVCVDAYYFRYPAVNALMMDEDAEDPRPPASLQASAYIPTGRDRGPSVHIAYPEQTVHEPVLQEPYSSSSDLSNDAAAGAVLPTDTFSITVMEGIEGEVVIMYKDLEMSMFYDEFLMFWGHDKTTPRSLPTQYSAAQLPNFKIVCPSFRRDRKFTPAMIQSALTRRSSLPNKATNNSPIRRPSVFDPIPESTVYQYNAYLARFILGQLHICTVIAHPKPLSPLFSTPFGSPIIDPTVISEQVPVVIACSSTPAQHSNPRNYNETYASPMRVKVILTQGSSTAMAPSCESVLPLIHPCLPNLSSSMENLHQSLTNEHSAMISSLLEESHPQPATQISTTTLPTALQFNIPSRYSESKYSSKRSLHGQDSYIESAKRLKFDA